MRQVREELYSTDNWYKAEIRSRGDDHLEIVAFKWTLEVVPGYGEVCSPFWERVAGGPLLANSPATARSLGVEELERLSGSVGWNSTWSCPDQQREESIKTTPGVEEESPGAGPHEDTSGSRLVESLRGIASILFLLTVLVLLFFASPVVWWFFGAVWAMGAAIASVVVSVLIPLSRLTGPVVLVNIIYCACAVVRLITS